MKTQTKRNTTRTKAASSPLRAGRQAPDFELPDDTGTVRRLSDFRGKPVVLYFYPADDTPGCTKEACNFRDDYSRYRRQGVAILGVSPDSEHSHERFKSKYDLPFPLLADADHRVCSLYGVWGRKQFMGRSYDGVLRTTFLIDGAGKIATVFEGVKPAEHSTEVLAEVKALRGAAAHG
jgi:peroxiredoxin Q/BCP